MHHRRSSIAIVLLILICGEQVVWASRCSRIPEGYGATKTPADGRYHIRIAENADKYVPGKTYTILLEGVETGVRAFGRSGPMMRHKFTNFMLVVEKKLNESSRMTEDFSSNLQGVFTLGFGDTQTKLTCGNMVTHTTTAPKSEIQVLWTAPAIGSGCVVFRATVVEHRDVWYMDDGPLSKEFCEDEQDLEDIHNAQTDPCCACTEAKYELTFEGMWSRNTHPKDFPTNSWLTRFSDIIGATHAIDYRFWQYGEQASEGLRQVAERGATRTLESELKDESSHIRTIIKARGLAYPNVTGKTFAVFRVDPINHLVSFVSMMDPSPDWFVGVSGLELCLPNCTWIESKVLDLYPWDAGTDSGATYISPDQPTNPKDHIRRIKADYPNDPRSPFYDPEGMKMKPLARLTLNRQRLYEKNCPNPEENGEGAGESDGSMPNTRLRTNPCATTRWGPWERCDSICGRGERRRHRKYQNYELAMQTGCTEELTHRQECITPCNNMPEENENPVTEEACALSKWSEWSECSPKCGNGIQYQTRHYQTKRARKYCVNEMEPLMNRTRPCKLRDCIGDIPGSEDSNFGQSKEINEDACTDLVWSQYEPCNRRCGGGTKKRFKLPRNKRCPPPDEPESEEIDCNNHRCSTPQFCNEDPRTGHRMAINKWYYNRQENQCEVFTWTGGEGDQNTFDTYENCTETCTGFSMSWHSRNPRQHHYGRWSG